MKRLFLLSGLGADERVFDFLDLSDYTILHIQWINPIPGESMAHYAKRLLPQITDPNPVLMGVSFGGMVAIEIAKLIPVEKIIQISSAKSPNAIPFYFRVMAKLKIQKLMPPHALKKPNGVLYWLFGVNSREHKALLASIMTDTDEGFLTWAIETVIRWENHAALKQIVTIHGTNDRILNLQSADYIIEGGGHLMIVNRAKEISAILKIVLGESP